MTLYRGPGGTGSATSDADTTLYQDFLNQTIAARDAALQAETNAELAETNAETAEANAETAEANAAASASAAATSASNASTSASNAASSASSASSSASAASTSASNAAVSASSAAASASAALASENNAETAETNAAASASAAATSASNAASSASAAATSATNAANSASSAATSATSASNSASNAATSATNAANSATSASNSATAAAASASEAAGYAASINPADLVHISGTETITGAKTFSQTITGSITGNAGTVTNGVYTTGDQTIAGTKTFSSNPVLSAGTVNGLAFLNASKVLTTGSALTFDGSNLGFGTTGQRITGDMSNATLANRLLIQTSTVNGNTRPGLIPNGTATTSELIVFNNSDPTNSQSTTIFTSATESSIRSNAYGTGASSYLPLTFYTNGSEQMRLTSTGLGIGTSSPAQKLHVSGGSVRVDNTNIMFLNPDYGPGTMAVQGFSNVPLVFCTNNTERLRISADGNLGLGVTPSAWQSLFKAVQVGATATISSYNGSNTNIGNNWYYANGTGDTRIASGYAALYQQDIGVHKWLIAGTGAAGSTISFTQAMTLDASGNLGIGTTSPGLPLHVNALNAFVRLTTTNDSSTSGIQFGDTSAADIGQIRYEHSDNSMRLFVNNAERARIDSSGNLLVGTTSTAGRITSQQSATNLNCFGAVSPGSFTASQFYSNSVSAAGTGWFHFYGVSSNNSVQNVIIFGNGNIQNANNSYGALSDVKLKENIIDTTPKLEKLCQVRVVNYNLKGDYEKHKQIGVVAQELEQIFPGMVDETPDRDAEGNDLGTTTKAVKYSVFVPMLIKAIQEQQAIIVGMKAELDALKAKVGE